MKKTMYVLILGMALAACQNPKEDKYTYWKKKGDAYAEKSKNASDTTAARIYIDSALLCLDSANYYLKKKP